MDSGSDKSIAEIVAGNDLNELLRAINAACARNDWDALVEIGERCERAIDRGFQLWPAAHHAAYRLALEAPSEWAGEVVVDGAAKFAPGPLSEVVAQFHVTNINFVNNSNAFDFDTQIILQMIESHQRIAEISIPTFYGQEISHVNSIKYGLQIIGHTLRFRFSQRHRNTKL